MAELTVLDSNVNEYKSENQRPDDELANIKKKCLSQKSFTGNIPVLHWQGILIHVLQHLNFKNCWYLNLFWCLQWTAKTEWSRLSLSSLHYNVLQCKDQFVSMIMTCFELVYFTFVRKSGIFHHKFAQVRVEGMFSFKCIINRSRQLLSDQSFSSNSVISNCLEASLTV